MAAVAQISVNFASRFQIESNPATLPTSVRVVTPRSLTEYLLRNVEIGDNAITDTRYMNYKGGFLTAGNKVNVKHESDLQLRQNLDIERNLYVDAIYARRKGNTLDTYQVDRSSTAPRTITLAPFERDITDTSSSNYINITTTSSTKSVSLFINHGTGLSDKENSIILFNDNSNKTMTLKTGSYVLRANDIDIFGPVFSSSTFEIDGQTTITDNVSISGNLNLGGSAYNRFNINGTNGSVSFIGNLNINTDKFTVTSSTGNTSIAGTLSVGSTLTVSGATTISSTLNVSNNLVVGTSRFIVNSLNGNTTIAGTLDISGVTTISSNLEITGNINLKGSNPTYKITNLNTPSNNFDASNKKYVDDRDNTRLPLAGGTMTGFITLHANPTLPMHAATKDYADNAVPTGAVMAFMRDSVNGWLLCDGRSTAGFPNLANIVGSNVPDLRGCFLRGRDNNRGLDPSGNRNLGNYQNDSIQNITGRFQLQGTEGIGIVDGVFRNDGSGGNNGAGHNGQPWNPLISFDASRVVRTSSETRPKNVCVNWFIKT